MVSEANVIEYTQAEVESDIEKPRGVKKRKVARSDEKGEIRFFGVRALVANPLSACEKIDKMFGSGGEAIVHYMWFECGWSLFDDMIKCNASQSPRELLKAMVEVQPRAGWGHLSMKIVRVDPPMVDIVVKNPPVKTLKGSQKHVISSFWAGILSRYFDRQLICKDFDYDADKDEFSCTITIPQES